MKKFNWMAVPGVVVGIFFIWIGISNIAQSPFFYIVWLVISGFSFYRSLRFFLGIGDISNYASTSASNDTSGVSERLRELEGLYNQGLITREEFDHKRQKILDEL